MTPRFNSNVQIKHCDLWGQYLLLLFILIAFVFLYSLYSHTYSHTRAGKQESVSFVLRFCTDVHLGLMVVFSNNDYFLCLFKLF